MFSNHPSEVTLNSPTRTVSAVTADRTRHRFLVGTCSLSPDNALHLLRFHEEINELAVDAVLHHDGEVWSCSTCPAERTLVLTCGGGALDGGIECKTRLWKVPDEIIGKDDEYYPDEEDGDGNNAGGGINASTSNPDEIQMEEICTLPVSGNVLGGRITDALWHPDFDEGHGRDVVTLGCDGVVSRWDLTSSGSTAVEISIIETASSSNGGVGTVTLPRASWDPHNTNLIGLASGSSLSIVDFRTDSHELALPNCHRCGGGGGIGGGVTDMDYNPNKPHVVVTSGQDGIIKFWDLRYTGTGGGSRLTTPKPMKICRGGHTHHITNVAYNSFHDQLVLTTGSDSIVNLWRVSSVSSAPLLELDDTNGDGIGSGGLNNAVSVDSEEEESQQRQQQPTSSSAAATTTGSTKGGDKKKQHGSDTNAPDVRVGKYEHPDSVYGMTWSAADAWAYVTLGYGGDVVLHHVPSKEKYKILL